jgi:hypothetical protein
VPRRKEQGSSPLKEQKEVEMRRSMKGLRNAIFRTVPCLALLAAVVSNGYGQDSSTELAKKTQNPVSDLISVPFQNNFNFGVGPEDKMQYLLNIQPVLPQRITGRWNWIHRVIIPVIGQPEPVGKFGLGDIQYQGFLSPAKPGKLIWGVGPVLSVPSATDDRLGTEKWSAGGGVLALRMDGPWVYGALANNIWSFAGNNDRDDVNQMLFQPFINYNLGKGLAIGTSPIITANWEAPSGQKWIVPLGAQVMQIIPIAKVPVNFLLGAYYNVERPDDGPDWSIRFQIALLFPK